VAAIHVRKLAARISRKHSAPGGATGDFELDALIARITIENRHEEICTGSYSSGNAA